jgi:hypothetical protein
MPADEKARARSAKRIRQFFIFFAGNFKGLWKIYHFGGNLRHFFSLSRTLSRICTWRHFQWKSMRVNENEGDKGASFRSRCRFSNNKLLNTRRAGEGKKWNINILDYDLFRKSYSHACNCGLRWIFPQLSDLKNSLNKKLSHACQEVKKW